MHMLFSGRTCLDVFSCRNIADGIQHSDYENQFVYMRKIIISKPNPVIREILKFKLNPGKGKNCDMFNWLYQSSPLFVGHNGT